MKSNPQYSEKIYTNRQSCRICGSASLVDVIRFPAIPIADALLGKEELNKPEIKVPLTFVICSNCFHAQIKEDALPEALFNKDYPYYTGISTALSKHFISSAQNLIQRFEINSTKKVLEIASNDGTMLSVFAQAGCDALGVDPATGPCNVAVAKGLNIKNTFFTSTLSDQLKKEFGEVDLIIGNNVLAHVPEPYDFTEGIAKLLSSQGHVVLEVPHLLPLLNHIEFDTIFHQHYSYFSVHTAEMLFEKHSIYLNDVEQIPIHGGSIRLYFSRTQGASDCVNDLKQKEVKAGLTDIKVYEDFAQKVNALTSDLAKTISELRQAGKTIAGYGAAGKANTLINVSQIKQEDLTYIADLSPYKQGKYFTGVHFPIVSPLRILEDMPDYVLILAWNFKDEIIQQLSEYQAKGGKFIIPIPEVCIIE